MKAKACTRCRQSKLRCDSDVTSPDPCTRCKTANATCVIDRSFQRVSKSKRLKELEAEVSRLRQSAASGHNGSATTPPVSDPSNTPQLPRYPHEVKDVVAPSPEDVRSEDKELGGVRLTPAQVADLFRIYFAQCHPYLDFAVSTDPGIIYAKSPLLFWVICAVASSTNVMLELQAGIANLVGQVVINPPRSVEVVQALLILCMWPFPFESTLADPSFIYCGIAHRISLQIGLHRPSLSQEFSSKRVVLEVDEDVRKSTWLACYVVNQMQTARLGVPHTIQADYTYHQILESPDMSPTLVILCRIARLAGQFIKIIGGNAQNITGLLDPAARVDMVRFFKSELDNLLRDHFRSTNSQVVEIMYLTARLYLWSFILQDDITRTHDVVELYYEAEKDAGQLVLIASAMNLSRCPFHIVRSVILAGLVLIKIAASPFAREPKVTYDQVMLASRSLQTAVRVEGDHAQHWSKILQQLPALRDNKRTPPVRSRMAATLIYDAVRIVKEHKESSEMREVQDTSPANTDTLFDVPDWMEIGDASALFDLDGLDWNNMGGLL